MAVIVVGISTPQAQENLHAIAYNSSQTQAQGWWITTFDFSTVPPAVIHSKKLTQLVGGLCHDGSDLYLFISPPYAPSSTWLARVNPADGVISTIGITGLPPNTNHRMDVHPVTGDIYVNAGVLRLYRIDKNTGEATFLAPLGPYAATTLAIDSGGKAWATGIGYLMGPGPHVYTVDLTSGLLTLYGDLAMGQGYFDDIAFDSNDVLWGSLRGFSSNPSTGLYRIDLNTLKATLVSALNSSHLGIAFGPSLPVQTYCMPKTNSLGCMPGIEGRGLPSASATSGFTINGRDVISGTPGILAFGTSGKASTPLYGGTLCMAGSLSHLPVTNSSGAGVPGQDCTGMWSLDFNAWLWGNQPHLQLAAGTTINCQWWGRDPGFLPPNNISLTDALEFTLYP